MSNFDYDVAIVGAGVSGALVANQLARAGFRVVVLEAGQELKHPSQQVESYYAADTKTPDAPWPASDQAPRPSVIDMSLKATFQDKKFYMQQTGAIPFNSTYERISGGTSTHWLGTCLRHVPNDFRLRSHYAEGAGKEFLDHARDWPLSYDEMEPWYYAAENEVGVSGDSKALEDFLGAKRTSGPYPMKEIAPSYLDQRLGARLDGKTINDVTIQVLNTPQGRNSIDRKDPDGLTRFRCMGNTSCIPICPIQAKYDATVSVRAAKAADTPAEFRYQHVVYKVDIDENAEVSQLRYFSYTADGQRSFGTLSAKRYVLAAHAIETAKLLLLSKWKNDNEGKTITVANSSGTVGQHLMDHVIHLSWGLADEPLFPFRGPLSTAGIGEYRDTAKRNERAAYRIEIGNDGWSWPDTAPLKTAWRLIYRGTDGADLDIIEDFFQRRNENPKWYGKELRASLGEVVSRQVRMAAEPEALPLPDSYVGVSPAVNYEATGATLEEEFINAFQNVGPDDKDAAGMPKPQVHYNVSEYTKRGFREGQNTLQQVFTELGVTKIATRIVGDGAAAEFNLDGEQFEYGGAGHIAGTYVMGDDPTNSTVNKDCRAHDHKNLFLLGSGVFPALGTANPTLTIMALALRAADQLKSELGT